MSTIPRCRAKDPATCKIHGTPEESALFIFTPESTQRAVFSLFKDLNETVKEELCESPQVQTLDSTDGLKTGYSFTCSKCRKIHYFDQTTYNKTSGGKALTYLFRQLPDEHRNTQFLGPLMSIQVAALGESFTRHFKDKSTKENLTHKLKNKLNHAASIKNIYGSIVVPPSSNEDWSSHPGGVKEGLDYVEPSNVPKELLYKFSQCLRKKQHQTAELARQSLVANSQEGKEVYQCPHCNKFHYGRPIEAGRTEEQRYEFAKKTWTLPAYRETVSVLVKTHGLKNK